MPYGKILSYIVLADKIFIPVSTMTFCWFMPSLFGGVYASAASQSCFGRKSETTCLNDDDFRHFDKKHEKTLKAYALKVFFNGKSVESNDTVATVIILTKDIKILLDISLRDDHSLSLISS